MITMQEIDSITRRILEKITPSQMQREKIEAITREMEQKVSFACKETGFEAIVRVEGSVAKDTWLRENPDIDVFLRLPKSIPRKNLGDIGLKIAKKAALGYQTLERFAEHPYLEVTVEGYRVDVVPCYDAKPGEWQSATDRTPYHTDYIKKYFDAKLRGEVRLLKKFMQGIEVYGAEIKVGGFSGYLCELLVLKYGSFMQTVTAFSHYKGRVVIDPESFYGNRERELSLLFPEPLVVVDPVDKGRNVASAVQPQKLYLLVAAAREFLKKPQEEYFFPPETQPLAMVDLKSRLDRQGSALIFLVINQVAAVPDVLWGQLYRTKRSIRKLLETSDFKVLQDSVWSDEKTTSLFTFELETQTLPNIKKHLGPPLEREAECENFLAKYVDNETVILGPYVEDGRWVVELPRKETNAAALLKEKLADGGKNCGVADLIAESIGKGFKVLINGEIAQMYENGDFAIFLADFLSGRPFWLKKLLMLKKL
jgi:tRNA nucleotidyltransferase (CCA-adding enzyme)